MTNEKANPQKDIEEYFLPPDVHKLYYQKPGGLSALVAGLLVCVGESYLLSEVLSGRMPVATGFIIHGFVILALMVYARLLLSFGRENRFALMLLLCTPLMGPFAGAGVVLAVLVHVGAANDHVQFAEMFETLFPSLLKSRAQHVFDDLLTGRDEADRSYSVIPFLDVLAFGNEVQKRQALSKMTGRFHPDFAPAFRRALQDDSNMIRVQAATAIAKIESQFLQQMIRLSSIKAHQHKDPLVVLAIAEHYDNYAYTGLLDADREQANRRKAIELYRQYLKLAPDNVDVCTRIGRILMRDGKCQEACDWLAECIGKNLTSDTLSDWYCEALYAAGRYGELRRYCASLPSEEKTNNQVLKAPRLLKSALDAWARGVA